MTTPSRCWSIVRIILFYDVELAHNTSYGLKKQIDEHKKSYLTYYLCEVTLYKILFNYLFLKRFGFACFLNPPR